MSTRTVILVHGAWAGAWCWGFLAAELDGRGIPHVAVDLPSRSPGPGSLADDAAVVRSAVDAAETPVILCGHSYGGMVVTEAASERQRIDRLVYLCAAMPAEGESFAGLLAADPRSSEIGTAIRMADDGTSTLVPAGARRIILNDATDEQAAMVAGALGSHRMGTLSEAASAIGWRGLPTTYVVCARDLVISAALQRRMAVHADEVVELDAGHAPMLTAAAALADVLAERATRPLTAAATRG